MKAWILHKPNTPLQLEEIILPPLTEKQVRVHVEACGICRTDLHIYAEELPHPSYPIIPGHQIVGIVEEVGSQVSHLQIGDRIGTGWLGKTCGHCPYCDRGEENLCDHIKFNGYNLMGGFAQKCHLFADYCFVLPKESNPNTLAPLLCAGLIGYRSYKKALPAKRIGFYGFGAAAHLLTQLALYEGKEIVGFTKAGDKQKQSYALSCGAVEAYSSEQIPSTPLDSAIVFAPAGEVVPTALRSVRKGGKVVLAGIHMSPIPSFSYDILWNERTLTSVANLTRQDAVEYLKRAAEAKILPDVALYSFTELNHAFKDLLHGKVSGCAVLSALPEPTK